jgi:Group II intron, maturase-specific domain
VLVHGTRADVEALREDLARVLAPLGLRLSAAKTQVRHMSEGFDFLGFRIQWRRKRGTNKWYVYTFIADRPLRSLKAKIRALTHRLSQQHPRNVLIRLNQIMRGWANYFKHAVCKHTMDALEHFVWWPGDPLVDEAAPLELEGRPPPPHRPHRPVAATLGGWDRTVQHRQSTDHPIPVPRHQDPQPLAGAQPRLTAETVESPLPRDRHGGFGERPGETDREQSRHRAPGRLNPTRRSC